AGEEPRECGGRSPGIEQTGADRYIVVKETELLQTGRDDQSGVIPQDTALGEQPLAHGEVARRVAVGYRAPERAQQRDDRYEYRDGVEGDHAPAQRSSEADATESGELDDERIEQDEDRALFREHSAEPDGEPRGHLYESA